MSRGWSTADKRNMAVAVVGFLAVMALLIAGGIIGANAGDDDGGNMMHTTTTTTEHLVTTDEPPILNEYRLPTALKPTHYTLRLQPFLSGDFHIDGSVEVEVDVVESTDSVTIHMVDITMKNETLVVKADDQAVGVTKIEADPDKQWTVLTLDKLLTEGQKVVVSLEYTGILNDDMRGFYRSSYTENGKTMYLAVSYFAATYARMAFPCMDEPQLKATYAVSLGREEHMKGVSNMPLRSQEPFPDQPGWVWDHFQTTLPMSTYLVAFVVSDFVQNSATFNNLSYAVWARESKIGLTDYALTVNQEAVEFFQDYFSIPYVLPKVDSVGIPDFEMGAMENWGLVTYREERLFYDPMTTSADKKQSTHETICHELAHMWFGDLVTPAWWNDIWLNEGFATYMSYLAQGKLEPEWMMEQQILVDVVSKVMGLDSLPSTHPISTPVQNPDEIGQIFDSISYDKGASLIRMMSHFLTEDTFIKGVTNYLNDFMFSSATQDDLWDHLTQAAHEDGTLSNEVTVKEVMDTWTLQKGYPVLSALRLGDGVTLILTQHHFLLTDSTDEGDVEEGGDLRWWIPVSYTSSRQPDFTRTSPQLWISPTLKSLTTTDPADRDSWLLVNVQQAGYYRVTYDDTNWALIMDQLKSDHGVIHVTSRMQLVDDALNLARAGILSYDTALQVTEYLSRETEYGPWSHAFSTLAYLESMMTRSAGYGALRSYMLDLLTPLYDLVGFEDDLSDPHIDQLTRALVVDWACHLGLDDCVTKATKAFSDWLENTMSLSGNVKESVLCTGVREGGVEAWEGVWGYYQSFGSSAGSEVLHALGCSQEMWLLSKTLELTFDETSPIRKQDVNTVFSSVASNDAGRTLAWTYLKDHWNTIIEYVGSYTGGLLINSVTKEFNTEVERGELLQFEEDHAGELSGVSRALKQAEDSTLANIKWMERSYDHVVDWLAVKNNMTL